MSHLPPLPAQAHDVPWPTQGWPEGPLPADVDTDTLAAVADGLFAEAIHATHGKTFALLFVHRGRLVFERYGEEHGPDLTCRSWSMAKSIAHALVGMRVGDGRLDPMAPAPVPRWSGEGDPRGRITLDDLLRMVDGLDFVEVYEAGGRSDVLEMLFQSGKDDVAAYAETRDAKRDPGRYWNYSSGTSNIVAGILGRSIGGGQAGMEAFLRERLFGPLGMTTAAPKFDAAGTFVASSYVFASARDFAKFGLLYLRDGVWEGRRLLPEGWVDHGRTLTPASFDQYGAHWWLAQDGSGIFSANGFQGQYIACVPTRDLVMVRLGESVEAQRIPLRHDMKKLVECFPLRAGAT